MDIIMRSKYNNRKVRCLGETFDSMLECERYKYLKALEQQKVISNLRRQVKYVLLPSQKDSKTQKTIEREITYLADFVYEKGSQTIVEDVKGLRTDVYKIKRKLMLYFHGIQIKEVTKEVKTWAI
ncbi:DUF1064 domain-containing protein [Ruminococcus bromii]|uniref:DUF1064 domain-containing protein n=1 Tax=Ruminococcus bromii TaxID=40518 RepID=UPI00241C4BC1|nr:DUF1064 domain-containing protein [Ruminococcus bromii]